jgi:hypothetical protein
MRATIIAVIAVTAVVAGEATIASPGSAGAPPPPVALAVVLHVAPPASDDPALAAADVALRAPEELGEPLRATRGRAGAQLSFALDPSYLAALRRAANGDSALRDLVAGKALPGGDAAPVLSLLARHRPVGGALARTRAGSRYLTLATAARNGLSGNRSESFSRQDLADFAGVDAQTVLAATGFTPATPEVLSNEAAVAGLERADKALLDDLEADVRAGSVELIATPDREPILPLLIDSGGRSTAELHIVEIGARADAEWLASDAVRQVCGAEGKKKCGFYSPFGAYDDATGAVIESAGSAYALFSDRVVNGAGGQGTQSALEAARGAALHAYALIVSKGVTLPTIFWSEAVSDQLDTTLGSDTAPGEAILSQLRDAGASLSDAFPHLLLVRLESQGPWMQRPDARSTIDHFVNAIAGSTAHATTPSAFLRAHPPTATAFGYPPNAESGSFALWMGSPNQASLWNALAAARRAAGGDAALARPSIRALLFAAEAGAWYSIPETPSSTDSTGAQVEGFRSLIAAIYRAAGIEPPAVIAPLKLASPAPAASPMPTARATPEAPGQH